MPEHPTFLFTAVYLTTMLVSYKIVICPYLGLVGLAISYALSVTNLLSGVVTSFTETEKQMVSVERAVQYIQEAPTERDEGTMEVSGVMRGEGGGLWE